MKTENQMIDFVKSLGVLPLFYHQDANVCVEVVKALYQAGVRCVEFTNRGAAAFENFKIILENRKQYYPDLILAIGTIHTQQDAQKYIDAGADFLISPFLVDITKNLASSFLEKVSTACEVSPFCSCRKFTRACPLLTREPSGSS